MGKEKPSDQYWNVKVYKPPLKSFESISRIPCMFTNDQDGNFAITTTRENATFWSVKITDKTGETFAVADCKDESTAIELENWIMYILKLLSGNRFL